MSAILTTYEEFTIFERMECHPAWQGNIPGLDAEKLLRGKTTPFLYIIRKGEDSLDVSKRNYYITFLMSDLSIKHQPLIITITRNGWCYEQGGNGGPYKELSIDSVLHCIMHCEEGQPIALLNQ